MNDDLQALIDAARTIQSSPSEMEEQRRSFAYGNTHFENELITREMIDEQADRIARARLENDDRR